MELIWIIVASVLLGCVPLEVFGQSETGLSQSEEQEILDAHNRLRGSVNPSAANMGIMVWR
jgi:hypothetical protein